MKRTGFYFANDGQGGGALMSDAILGVNTGLEARYDRFIGKNDADDMDDDFDPESVDYDVIDEEMKGTNYVIDSEKPVSGNFNVEKPGWYALQIMGEVKRDEHFSYDREYVDEMDIEIVYKNKGDKLFSESQEDKVKYFLGPYPEQAMACIKGVNDEILREPSDERWNEILNFAKGKGGKNVFTSIRERIHNIYNQGIMNEFQPNGDRGHRPGNRRAYELYDYPIVEEARREIDDPNSGKLELVKSVGFFKDESDPYGIVGQDVFILEIIKKKEGDDFDNEIFTVPEDFHIGIIPDFLEKREYDRVNANDEIIKDDIRNEGWKKFGYLARGFAFGKASAEFIIEPDENDFVKRLRFKCDGKEAFIGEAGFGKKDVTFDEANIACNRCEEHMIKLEEISNSAPTFWDVQEFFQNYKFDQPHVIQCLERLSKNNSEGEKIKYGPDAKVEKDFCSVTVGVNNEILNLKGDKYRFIDAGDKVRYMLEYVDKNEKKPYQQLYFKTDFTKEDAKEFLRQFVIADYKKNAHKNVEKKSKSTVKR